MKNPEKVEKMRKGGKIIVSILREILKKVTPGVTTLSLDEFAEQLCEENAVRPAFKGYSSYPATLCVGPNDVVVHGIPDDTPLNSGDIVSVDFGIIYDGVYLDMARTVPVGTISSKVSAFVSTAEAALAAGCEAARAGNTVGDIGYAISSVAEAKGYSVVREMVGHGVGYKLHEDPMVPGYGRKGEGARLYAGQTLAIEAIINEGTSEIAISTADGWTSRTKDGKLSALFENTVCVLEESEILTPL